MPDDPDADSILCAACGEATRSHDACASCGRSPLLDGRYALTEVLGRGAVGTTYRARSPEGDEVAIKELLVSRLPDFKHEELFRREARVLGQLDHPGVPRLLDELSAGSGKQTGFYLVEELIEGQTLQDWRRTHRPTEREVLELLAELLELLDWLHRRTPAVVHRDVKPSNVIRASGDGRLVLVDFGMVRDALKGPLGGSTVAGTFGYMPPEQLAGRAVPASDVYAAGALALALLTGGEPQDMLDSRNQLRWRSRVDISRPFERLLADMLEPEVERRAADAGLLAARARKILTGSWELPVPVGAEREEDGALVWRETFSAPVAAIARMHRRVVSGAAGIGAAALAAAIVFRGPLVTMALITIVWAATVGVVSQRKRRRAIERIERRPVVRVGHGRAAVIAGGREVAAASIDEDLAVRLVEARRDVAPETSRGGLRVEVFSGDKPCFALVGVGGTTGLDPAEGDDVPDARAPDQRFFVARAEAEAFARELLDRAGRLGA